MAHARYVRQGHGIWQCFYVEDKGEKTITLKRGQDKGKEKVVRNMIIGCRFCGWTAAWSRQNFTEKKLITHFIRDYMRGGKSRIYIKECTFKTEFFGDDNDRQEHARLCKKYNLILATYKKKPKHQQSTGAGSSSWLGWRAAARLGWCGPPWWLTRRVRWVAG